MEIGVDFEGSSSGSPNTNGIYSEHQNTIAFVK